MTCSFRRDHRRCNLGDQRVWEYGQGPSTPLSLLTPQSVTVSRAGPLVPFNVYDHVSAHSYRVADAVQCSVHRNPLTQRLLTYVKNTLEVGSSSSDVSQVWHTNSLELRDWWLQRDRRRISPATTVTRTTSWTDVQLVITTSSRAGNPTGALVYPPLSAQAEFWYSVLEPFTALRIYLDPVSAAQAAPQSGAPRVQVYLNNSSVPNGAYKLDSDGRTLHVKIGDSANVRVRLGQ